MKLLAFTIFHWFSTNGLISPNLFSTNNQDKSFKSNLYNFIAENILNNGNQTENYLKDKCMIYLINEVFEKNGITYIFIADGQRHDNLVHQLQLNFIHSYYTEPNDLTTFNLASYHHLLIFHNKINVEKVMEQLKPIQGTKFFLLVRDYKEAIKKFRKLWEYRMVDAVATFMENETLYYYTYFPYDDNHCGGVGSPHLVAKCDTLHGLFFHKKKLFPRKDGNLHKCPINVTFVQNIPSSYYSESQKLIGWEVDIIKEIIKHLNGVPKFKLLPSRRKVYEPNKGYHYVVKTSDVGGGAVVSLRGLSKTDFCFYGQSVCTVWVVPKRSSISHSAGFIFKVFSTRVWIFLIASFFIMAATYRLLFKVTLANVLFKLLPFLLGTTTRTRGSSRILGSTWLYFCVFINAIYQSGYQSTSLVPHSTPQLSTTNEIFKSKLNIVGFPDLIKDDLIYYKRKFNISSKRLKLINQELTFKEWMHRMAIKKDSAYLGFKETIHYHLDRTELANVVNIPETCNMKYLLSFVLKKNSHLTVHFVKYSNRLNENGFVVFFMRKHLSRESKQNIPNKIRLSPSKNDGNDMPRPVDLNKIFAVFVFYVVGIIIAFKIFLLEILSQWKWQKIKKIFQYPLDHNK